LIAYNRKGQLIKLVNAIGYSFFSIRIKYVLLIILSTLILFNVADSNGENNFYSINFSKVSVEKVPDNETDYDLLNNKDSFFQYQNNNLFDQIWVKKTVDLSIKPIQVRSIEIRHENENISVLITLDPDSKEIIEKVFAYTKNKIGEKIAISVENNIIAIPAIITPMEGSLLLSVKNKNLSQIKDLFLKVTQDVKMVDLSINEKKSLYEKTGDGLFNKGHYSRAIIEYSRAIETTSRNKALFYRRGICYSEVGENIKAIEDFNTAIEIDPSFDFAYSMRGLTWVKTRNYKKAISDYKVAIELNPWNFVHYTNLAWLYATCEISGFRNGSMAVELSKKAIKLNGAMVNYDTIAAAFAEIGNFKDAVRIQEASIRVLIQKSKVDELHEAQKRLKSYQDKMAWREAVPIPKY